jgi:hypothetical protein
VLKSQQVKEPSPRSEVQMKPLVLKSQQVKEPSPRPEVKMKPLVLKSQQVKGPSPRPEVQMKPLVLKLQQVKVPSPQLEGQMKVPSLRPWRLPQPTGQEQRQVGRTFLIILTLYARGRKGGVSDDSAWRAFRTCEQGFPDLGVREQHLVGHTLSFGWHACSAK